ncbi:hypothetical protein QZH41_008065 [Actinostola sp. cb2023]|nr:hypothetical protein QZH41_008065 [Actinostola sp. cb2023]
MLVACQEELEFDEGDKEAMDSRLNKYLFRRLPKKHFHAYAWIRKHPMDAIVWAMRKSTTHRSQTDEGETIDGLSKQDQAELFQCGFEDIEIDEDENSVRDTQSCQEQIAGDHDDQSNAEDVQPARAWETSLKRATVSEQGNVFRRRLIKTLLTSVQDEINCEQNSLDEMNEKELRPTKSQIHMVNYPQASINKY